jgi:hypothetical protein
LNSGLHTCQTSTLLLEPCLQFWTCRLFTTFLCCLSVSACFSAVLSLLVICNALPLSLSLQNITSLLLPRLFSFRVKCRKVLIHHLAHPPQRISYLCINQHLYSKKRGLPGKPWFFAFQNFTHHKSIVEMC